MDDNKKLPAGWGSDEDDDYGFSSEDDETPAWGSGSPFQKAGKLSENADEPAADAAKIIAQPPAPETVQPVNSVAPAAQPARDPDPPAPAYTPPVAAAGKSKVVPVLIAVIAVLLVAVGFLGGMFLMKNKDEKGSDDPDIKAAVTTAKDTDPASTAVSENQENTSATTTIVTDVSTETTTTTTAETETTTTKAAAPKASITASLVAEPAYQGRTVYLVVAGDYSSYSYTSYCYDVDGSTYLLQNGNSSADKIEITAFSGGVKKVVVEVTPYNIDGWAGDTVSATYIPGNDRAVKVTSCTKYGTIYSPSGSKVDGLTRSYLIDGGAASYERHDLTHGWHITAVNQYYDGSTYWYELYDSDDGDYYGWVASYNISFY